MTNYRQAPKLYHVGSKSTKGFYQLPHNLMEPIFNQLDRKNGNQIKLMIALIGTKGDGSFKVTEKWICDRTGMKQSSYSRARTALIEKGWLKLENGKLEVLFDKICGTATSEHAHDMSSGGTSCAESMPETCADSMHNKEKININNIKEINSPAVFFNEESENEAREQVQSDIPENFAKFVQNYLNLDFNLNTAKAIADIIGERIDYIVLRDLINRNMQTFIIAKRKGSGYVYGTLMNKVREGYAQEKAKHEALILQQERDREERKKDAAYRKAIREMEWRQPPKEESKVDILQMLLDEEAEEKRRRELQEEQKHTEASVYEEVDFDAIADEEYERRIEEHGTEAQRLILKIRREAREDKDDPWAK